MYEPFPHACHIRTAAPERKSDSSNLTSKVCAFDVCCHFQSIELTLVSCAGFENREKVYRNFPEALLHWKVALEVVGMALFPHSFLSFKHKGLG